MTCFWDAIMASLNHEDYLLLNLVQKPCANAIIDVLKQINVKATLVKWNNKNISKQESDEHFQAIKCYNTAKIYNDLLILYATLFCFCFVIF